MERNVDSAKVSSMSMSLLLSLVEVVLRSDESTLPKVLRLRLVRACICVIGESLDMFAAMACMESPSS